MFAIEGSAPPGRRQPLRQAARQCAAKASPVDADQKRACRPVRQAR